VTALEELYDYAFHPYRHLRTSVLEIGRNGSGRTIKEMFPVAKMLCVVKPEDAYHPAFVGAMGFFSVIIDAGRQTYDTQRESIRLYAKHLSPQGVMVVEGIPSAGRLANLTLVARVAGFQEDSAFEMEDDTVTLVLK